ncbi:Transcriptional regulator, AcrR family [hydrothermal vent metagenome]|uniref:Transcriptional regulator, AcrR family n=1 Tax=hydrothermal vent metagenome TaxID=652676 RepID=A0A3B1C118_9ZZZZ
MVSKNGITRFDTETRQVQIKKAVLEIISTEGLSKLSTRNVADRIGVSEGTIFRHFKTKLDIFFGILEDVNNDLLEELRLIAFSKIPADKKLYNFLCANIRYLTKNKGITILLFTEAAYMNAAELKSDLYQILVNQKIYITKIVEDGIKEGIWDSEINIDNFAMLYMGIPITHNIEMILSGDKFKEKDFCKSMVCMLERMLNKK